MNNLKPWFVILCMVFLLPSTIAVINAKHLLFRQEQWEFYLYWISPWILTFLALRAWHQCFVWRRMLYARENLIKRLRGLSAKNTTQPPSRFLEYICAFTFCLGLWAILVQLKVENPRDKVLWCLIGWIVLRQLLSSGKRL